jgi:transcription elongation factor Elf1
MSDMFDDEETTSGGQRATAFDCVDCNANNPVDDGFGGGDEVTCHYCGSSFKVVASNGKFKFKAI